MMELYRSIKKSRLPWLLFYIGLTIELLIVIIDKSNYINPFEGLLFRITFLFFAFKLLLTDYSIKEWCVIVLLEAVAFVSYRITGANDLIRLVTFVVACKGIPLKQMLRYTFYITLVGCMTIILLSVTGIYGAVSLTADFGRGYEQTRYTLGMGHPNAFACMFLMLVVLGVYVFADKMKWYFYLLLMLLNAGVYYLTDSNTGMLVTSLFLIGSFFMTYVKSFREKSVVYFCGFLLFVLCLGYSVDGAVQAKAVRTEYWDEVIFGGLTKNIHLRTLVRLDLRLNGRILSLTDSDRNDGAVETWSAFSSPENMDYYFDMGWVKVFYRYGIVPGMIYCLACFWLLWKLYRRRDAFGLLLFVTFAVYTVIEAHLVSVYLGRNYLLMMMGYYLTGVDSIQDAPVGRL